MLSNKPENYFMQKLLARIAWRCPGGVLPSTYLVFDTETGGDDLYSDRIIEFGFCFVFENKVQEKMSFLVKRPREFVIKEAAFKAHGISHELLEKEGIEPLQAFTLAHELFSNWRKSGHMVMGHNAMAFDAPMFERESHLLGFDWKFGDNEIIDTGMVVKGTQLPYPIDDHDSLRAYYSKVSETHSHVRWSLDRYCIKEYHLDSYGIDPKKTHRAGEDCFITHCLYQEMNSGVV